VMVPTPAETMTKGNPVLSTVEEAIEEYRNGRSVIIVDDEDRENEGDLTIAAQFCTPEAINFMARNGRGLICVAMTGDRLDQLRIPMMVDPIRNGSMFGTSFTISVEARKGVTTGISAADRAQTVQALIDPHSTPEDIVSPGHMFPLRAREGGVLVRAGQTEATVDLCRMAGLYPAGVLCEIMKPDGTMARMPDLLRFARRYHLKVISVAQLIAYRMRMEKLVQRVDEAELPTQYGDFRVYAYRTMIDSKEHIALVRGTPRPDMPVLVRVHDQCLTSDVFGSLRCDCGEQKDAAMRRIAEEGGVFLYMDQEGRGIGLHNKIRAYALQDQGMDTVEANVALGFPPDKRDYGVGCQILVDLGVGKMRLLTNNPVKRAGLDAYGLSIVESVPLIIEPNKHNLRYLETKRTKMGHLLPASALPVGGEVEVS
jgi:3,4-dihydroxy 2-butanone 4-phosphate synthase / GTP cyclohydrolase II